MVPFTRSNSISKKRYLPSFSQGRATFSSFSRASRSLREAPSLMISETSWRVFRGSTSFAGDTSSLGFSWGRRGKEEGRQRGGGCACSLDYLGVALSVSSLLYVIVMCRDPDAA